MALLLYGGNTLSVSIIEGTWLSAYCATVLYIGLCSQVRFADVTPVGRLLRRFPVSGLVVQRVYDRVDVGVSFESESAVQQRLDLLCSLPSRGLVY
ncbi:hypothetical protein FB45DRAFT_1063884 [Roridomyces roridus]|uniref:Uncharacterized protein n=1 Tax=Roridomyces roridus TaxID=1738132 RepID=A0AAD7FEW8_9AGAR|nr:hypothetical protein FB45DRAFT_1063884 [Roridomyces roridus]